MSALHKRTSSETKRIKAEPKQEDYGAAQLRRELALIVTGIVSAIALIASLQVGAMPVLDKMLPLVAIIFGFFFGHRARKS